MSNCLAVNSESDLRSVDDQTNPTVGEFEEAIGHFIGDDTNDDYFPYSYQSSCTNFQFKTEKFE